MAMRPTSELKILYAVTDPVTATAFLRGQLAFLRQDGFEVHLACGLSADLENLAAEEKVTLHEVPLSRSWRLGDAARAVVEARRILRSVRPQVLNYSTPKASLVWAIASRFSQPCRVVYLLRGLRLEGESRHSLRFLLLWALEFIACRSADVVVCVSHGLRCKATELRLVRRSRAVVLGAGSSNGVDTQRFGRASQLRLEIRRELGYSREDIAVGLVGRLTRDKGIHELLAAMSRLDDRFRLLLVGSPEPDVKIPDLLENYPSLKSRILHIEHTSCVESYYAAMDIFVLPSYREGMSNALLEAQAAGLPCVTTEATGCRDAVVPGFAELVPVRDSRALLTAIQSLAAHPERRRRYGAEGKSWVAKNFQPHDLWRRYAALYRGQLPVQRAQERDVA